MSLPVLVVEEGNSAILQMVVRDSITGVYRSDAVVRVTVSQGGVEVGGQEWPLDLPYVLGSQGVYRGQLEDDVEMVAGQTYLAEFAATVAGITRHIDQEIYCAQPTGDTPPASSPASPAYEGPSLQTRLNEAEAAYHKLMLGGAVTVVVDQNGERIEYSAGSLARLSSYIMSLKAQLGLSNSAPMKVYYQ